LNSDNYNYGRYDKVKHLVEVNDDILAVFVINSSNQMEGLHIAKYAGIDKSTIEQIFSSVLISEIESKDKYLEKNLHDLKNILDLLLWEVSEYRKLRILKIYEKEKVIVVLIKSNTKLEHTIDNILGYYFESNDDDDDVDVGETPKSLF
jgi:hypothetical protein